MNGETEEIIAARVSEPIEQDAWEAASPTKITRYWSGDEAPSTRHAQARLVWSAEALYVRFVCRQAEPLVVAERPSLDSKTIGLWERDVCEIFIAPDPTHPERYFEFEAAPTGEWLDLAILWQRDGRQTDWNYQSGMRVQANVRRRSTTIVMHLPWRAFGQRPAVGDRWRVNLFRCVGAGSARGYLAWRPTRTPRPDFHVPAAFGWLSFAD
ncbi:carbohydrate-binding family 9-like protein [Pyrinomonas sp.]|uniref:carbohydrate-binding family 9-like protein n=1 Tax=Pyrinomonas sp. TaxID=2080306 RepID=UPI00332373B3